VARRQGLITSSFQDGPNGEKARVYHSWDYKEPNLDFTLEPVSEPVLETAGDDKEWLKQFAGAEEEEFF
jgi:hypothetical protein